MLCFMSVFDPQGFVTIIEYVVKYFSSKCCKICQGIALNGVEPTDHNGLIEV